MPTNFLFRKIAVLSAFYATAASSLGADFYDGVKSGTLEGKLTVQWIEADVFLFIPDTVSPLTFTRASGQKIRPGRMLTDGGSVPRPLWILRSYSPWGYAPAFIFHDWLFEMKHCKYSGFDTLNHREAANVMAEVMKTMMETNRVSIDRLTVWSMHAAVDSSIAENRWNSGACNPPPPGMFGAKPLLEYKLNFD